MMWRESEEAGKAEVGVGAILRKAAALYEVVNTC